MIYLKMSEAFLDKLSDVCLSFCDAVDTGSLLKIQRSWKEVWKILVDFKLMVKQCQ